jgi:hypothetical protein
MWHKTLFLLQQVTDCRVSGEALLMLLSGRLGRVEILKEIKLVD